MTGRERLIVCKPVCNQCLDQKRLASSSSFLPRVIAELKTGEQLDLYPLTPHTHTPHDRLYYARSYVGSGRAEAQGK